MPYVVKSIVGDGHDYHSVQEALGKVVFTYSLFTRHLRIDDHLGIWFGSLVGMQGAKPNHFRVPRRRRWPLCRIVHWP